MGDDPQRLKKIAAESYDYDSDPRWADYWSNILIPPEKASRSDVIDHYKRKFYQRCIQNSMFDPDLVVEPMASTNSSQSTRPSSSSAPPPTTEEARPRNTETKGMELPGYPSVASVIALIPVLCRAIELVAKFLRHNFSRSFFYRKYLEELCVWVESNTTTLSILSSNAEIGMGFLLVLSLFSRQRNIIQTFMYWQIDATKEKRKEKEAKEKGHPPSPLLKLMYHAPVTAGYHQTGDTFAMWTTPLPNQGQQPLAYPEAAASGNHHSSGSVGPFFAVLSVITILAVLSCLMGRVCAARLEGVDSRYDCLAWVRRRCRRCIADHAENGVQVDEDDKVEEHPPAAQA
ncbi:hypothetical protein ACLOJK_032437 [Asimina triloba]